jgi:DNA-binding response OmpR family regulator
MSGNKQQSNLTKVLVIDDDPVLRAFVEAFLVQHGCTVSSAEDGDTACSKLASQLPEIIVLDIVMPGRDGLFWLGWLKENHPQIPVIILSSKTSPDDRVTGLELGADDYLSKPFHPRELLIRINLVLGRSAQEISNVQPALKIGDCYFHPDEELLIHKENTPQIRLSPAETRLLLFFCRHAGTVLTRDAISFSMHGNEHHPLDRRIDMQINRLRKKLNSITDASRHLHTVWRKGYRFTL